MIGAERSLAQLFSRHLFNLPISDDRIALEFCDRTIDPLSLCQFLFQHSSLESLKNNKMLRNHNTAILKLAAGASSYDEGADDEVLNL